MISTGARYKMKLHICNLKSTFQQPLVGLHQDKFKNLNVRGQFLDVKLSSFKVNPDKGLPIASET